MNSVVDIRSYRLPESAPTLVLIDLQKDCIDGWHSLETGSCARAISNCRTALMHARQMGFPVAFVRRPPKSDGPVAAPRWIDGFEPRGSEMVFDREKPSCFASALFADAMAIAGGPIALAGFAGDTACLASAIDAFHRDHDFTFLSDASASRDIAGVAADRVHAVLSGIIGRYGRIVETESWIRITTPTRAHGQLSK
jgi:nicotinamidase-related amidase